MPNKLTHASRAKLFLPFDALKGFQAALREKERIQVSRPMLSKEAAETINHTLMRLQKRMMVRVVYYREESYVEQVGWVSAISAETQTLTVVQTKISFRDLYALECAELLKQEKWDFNQENETIFLS